MLGSSSTAEVDISKLGKDTLAEMSNQIAGEFMTILVGEEKVYELGIPDVSDEPFDTGKYNPVINFKINEHLSNPVYIACTLRTCH